MRCTAGCRNGRQWDPPAIRGSAWRKCYHCNGTGEEPGTEIRKNLSARIFILNLRMFRAFLRASNLKPADLKMSELRDMYQTMKGLER